jgi:hypothetical protein
MPERLIGAVGVPTRRSVQAGRVRAAEDACVLRPCNDVWIGAQSLGPMARSTGICEVEGGVPADDRDLSDVLGCFH